jgi:hypothetical protein
VAAVDRADILAIGRQGPLATTQAVPPGQRRGVALGLGDRRAMPAYN